MGFIIRMAARNLWRNRRRSMLAFLSVALSVSLSVFFQGAIGGFIASLVKNFTKNETGHIRIVTSRFLDREEFMPVDAMIPDPKTVEAKIEADPSLREGIAVVAERITFGVLLDNQGRNKAAVALGGDPATEASFLYLQKAIEPGGKYIDGPRQAIVGASLARDLGLAVGGALKVVTEASDGSTNLKKFTIVGLFNTGVSTMDERFFQIPLDDARTLLRAGNAAQQIIIMLKDYRRADALAARISDLLDDRKLAVVPWTATGDYPSVVREHEKILNFTVFIVLFLGVFIITNIMMMVILERRKEIGILRSMGFQRGEILVLFLSEGVFLGFWGSLFGAAMGFGANLFFHSRGMNFAYLGMVGVPTDSIIYWTIDPLFIVGMVLLGSAAAGLVSILPSLRAARMKVVDAIKSV